MRDHTFILNLNIYNQKIFMEYSTVQRSAITSSSQGRLVQQQIPANSQQNRKPRENLVLSQTLGVKEDEGLQRGTIQGGPYSLLQSKTSSKVTHTNHTPSQITPQIIVTSSNFPLICVGFDNIFTSTDTIPIKNKPVVVNLYQVFDEQIGGKCPPTEVGERETGITEKRLLPQKYSQVNLRGSGQTGCVRHELAGGLVQSWLELYSFKGISITRELQCPAVYR